jgi:hypothetical protein
MKSLLSGICAVWAAVACVGFAAPEPAIVPRPGEWTVDVTFEHPEQIVLQRTAKSKPERFWYTIITLANNTDQDVDFYPKCELMTDTFQIIPAGKNVPTAVFQLIKTRHQGKYPFLERLEKADNKILQGEDHAKDLAIIWPDFDAQATGIKVFITGLSNETAAIDHPIQKDEAGQPVKVFLRKTLQLSYALEGDPALRPYLKVAYKDQTWVMR